MRCVTPVSLAVAMIDFIVIGSSLTSDATKLAAGVWLMEAL
jgi:hypothetical protein